MNDKQRFVQQSIDALTLLAHAVAKMGELLEVYWARGYSAPETQITDDDLQSMGLTAADVANIMYLMDSLLKFMNGEEVQKGKFIDTVHKYRHDL